MPWRPTRTRASDPQSGLLGDGAVTCGVCRPDESGAASRRREIPMSFPTACRGTNRSADTCANRSARLGAGPAAGSGGGALRRCPGHLLAPGSSTDGGEPSCRHGAGSAGSAGPAPVRPRPGPRTTNRVTGRCPHGGRGTVPLGYLPWFRLPFSPTYAQDCPDRIRPGACLGCFRVRLLRSGGYSGVPRLQGLLLRAGYRHAIAGGLPPRCGVRELDRY